jgi:uncharacterized protein (TIGR02246 family)
MKTLLICLIFTSGFLCGCASTSPMVSKTRAPEDLAAIRKLYADNTAALNAEDISALARFYEEGAIQLPPDSPALAGWEAIRSSLQNEFKGVKLDAALDVVEAASAGSWAFARGTYRIVMVPQEGGRRTEATGNWLDILRRQSDGSWKIARSTWSNKQ